MFKRGNVLMMSHFSFSRFRKRWTYLVSGAFFDDYSKKLAHRRPSAELQALYQSYHDIDAADDEAAAKTEAAFSRQWDEFPKGNFLLSDDEFRESLPNILSSQELCIETDWFRGKDVLDVGCGNGRWTYAFSKLGANVTSVDASEMALSATKNAIDKYAPDVSVNLLQSRVEQLEEVLSSKKFDVVFCWGVLHHCRSFTQALEQTCKRVKSGGVLYMYLYGRETIPVDQDLMYFADRLKFNALQSDEARLKFLLRKAGGDRAKLHNVHDIYAPLINRRFEFDEVREMLAGLGFDQAVRTIDHSELFIRAIRDKPDEALANSLKPSAQPPYWFQAIPKS